MIQDSLQQGSDFMRKQYFVNMYVKVADLNSFIKCIQSKHRVIKIN